MDWDDVVIMESFEHERFNGDVTEDYCPKCGFPEDGCFCNEGMENL